MKSLLVQLNNLNLDHNQITELDAVSLLKLLHDLPDGESILLTTEIVVPLRKQIKIQGCIFENPWVGETIIKRSTVRTRAKPCFGKERRLTGLSDRIIKPRKWGQRLAGTPFVVHMPKGTTEIRMYLEVIVLESLNHMFYLKNTGEKLNGQQIKQFQYQKHGAGVRKEEIIWRDYDVRNITLLETQNKKYQISKNFKLNHK